MKGGIHLKPALLMVGLYLFLKFGMPLFTAPLPASLIMLYLMLTFSGIMIFMTLSGTSMESFLGPIFRFISGDGQDGSMKTGNWGASKFISRGTGECIKLKLPFCIFLK